MATDAAAKIITGDFGKWVEITQAVDRETENVERVKNLHNQPDEWPADQESGFYQDRLKRMRAIQTMLHDYDLLASLVTGKKVGLVELYPSWVELAKAVKIATRKVEAVVHHYPTHFDRELKNAVVAWQKALDEMRQIQETAHKLRSAWHLETFAPGWRDEPTEARSDSERGHYQKQSQTMLAKLENVLFWASIVACGGAGVVVLIGWALRYILRG
jgi:hypothetical protein